MFLDEIVALGKEKYPNEAYFVITMDEKGDIKTAFASPKGMRNSDLLGMIEVGKMAHVSRFIQSSSITSPPHEKLEISDESDKHGSPI